LEWAVVEELHPSDEDVLDDSILGLKNILEITRANHDMRLAHLFLHLAFKESKKSNCFHFLYFNLQSSSSFTIIT
jgi:hypothetical protein